MPRPREGCRLPQVPGLDGPLTPAYFLASSSFSFLFLPCLPLASVALSCATPSSVSFPPRRAVSGLWDPGREEQPRDSNWGRLKPGLSLYCHPRDSRGKVGSSGRSRAGQKGP